MRAIETPTWPARWSRRRTEAAATLREALDAERTDPDRAHALYARAERANRLPVWWLVLLTFGSVGAATVVMHLTVVDSPADIAGPHVPGYWRTVALGTLMCVAAMLVPVYACLRREARIVDRPADPVVGGGRLAGRAVVLSILFLLLETPRVVFSAAAIALGVGLLEALLFVPVSVVLDVPMPSPTGTWWFYSPALVAGGLVGIWFLMGGKTFEEMLPPLPWLAAIGIALRENPSELLMGAAFFAAGAVLAGTRVEIPYEAIAATFPVALVVFRDGLTGRDPAITSLARLGRMRTSLWRGGRGHWRRVWADGEVVWLNQRFSLEFEREDLLHVGFDEDSRNRPARHLKYYVLSLVRGSRDPADLVDPDLEHEIGELVRDELYASAWRASAENTQRLMHHLWAAENDGRRLPNAGEAVVEEATLTSYFLDPDHPTGRRKAAGFRSALGIGPRDWGRLRDQLLHGVRTEPATPFRTASWGLVLWVVVPVEGRQGQRGRVTTAWYLHRGPPRLLTAFVGDATLSREPARAHCRPGDARDVIHSVLELNEEFGRWPAGTVGTLVETSPSLSEGGLFEIADERGRTIDIVSFERDDFVPDLEPAA